MIQVDIPFFLVDIRLFSITISGIFLQNTYWNKDKNMRIIAMCFLPYTGKWALPKNGSKGWKWLKIKKKFKYRLVWTQTHTMRLSQHAWLCHQISCKNKHVCLMNLPHKGHKLGLWARFTKKACFHWDKTWSKNQVYWEDVVVKIWTQFNLCVNFPIFDCI